jgi:hypothetical protein
MSDMISNDGLPTVERPYERYDAPNTRERITEWGPHLQRAGVNFDADPFIEDRAATPTQDDPATADAQELEEPTFYNVPVDHVAGGGSIIEWER